MTPEKTCNRCGETKPITQFWRKASGLNGLQAACKACSGAEISASRMRSSNVLSGGQKRCTGCDETKPGEEFCGNKNYPDGLHYRCKLCQRISNKKFSGDPENRRKISAAARRRMGDPKRKDAYYDQRKRRQLGLPKEWNYRAMLTAQSGVCAICGANHNPGMSRFAIDHCGRTGAVRGLLCTTCNQALGQMRDSPDLLRKAAAYLEKPPGPQV